MAYFRPHHLCQLTFLIYIFNSFVIVKSNSDSKRLYAELLSTYNKVVRPVGNNSDRLTIKLGLKLSQLIDVNLRTQIMTTNMWVEQEWPDYKLTWNPEEFGGVETLHVPSEHIWIPDVVLYNNADGNYEVTMMTKAILNYTGIVKWKPPAIYKSYCEINVEYFPFDQQVCTMKFGSWAYDGYTVDLRHITSDGEGEESDHTEVGIDLQDYYISVEWDIMGVPATRHEKYYSCCNEPFIDIVFSLVIRRKTLFYTVNLIAPCVGITFLSILVFYLPSDSGEKMSLCISILLSLTVFFLLLTETIPPTSLAVPLLGKYLLFTMTLITLSVIVTICILNVNYRSPATHKMAPWVKNLFVEFLPKYLFLQRPGKDNDDDDGNNAAILGQDILRSYAHTSFEHHELHGHGLLVTADSLTGIEGGIDPQLQVCHIHGLNHLEPPTAPTTRVANALNLGVPSAPQYPQLPSPIFMSANDMALRNYLQGENQIFPDEIQKSATQARFIAQRLRNKDRFGGIEEDWKFVAMVLDRLFLWVFTLACVFGTAGIILQAPSLYDTTVPIDIQHSKIAKQKLMQMGSEEI